MTVTFTSRDVVDARVGDSQALLRNITATLPKTQFLREIPFNSIQACQRAIAAGAVGGHVQVDYVRTPAGVAKLRVWDTGDGMSPTDLHDRLGSLSAAARTESNFGIGAKLALTRVSPYGVVYQTLRDGQASLARWQQDPTTRNWGLAVLNPAGTTDRERAVIPADLANLPEEILTAGHGTSVTILGVDARDDTTWTLRPDGSSSKRWTLEVLNDRFTTIPDGVEVRVVMPNVEKDSHGGFKDDVRTVAGSAANLKYYTRNHAGSSDPATGARGKVRIGGPIPATAYWWVLPVTKHGTPSYMRIGGKVRIVTGGEAYETLGAKYMTAAGVWNSSTRVEIHFVPDPQAGAIPDLQRTKLTVDGEPMPVLEWCEEFKRSMPAAIKNLLAGSARAQASADYTSQLTELSHRLQTAPVARRRGRLTSAGELTHTGQVVPVTGAQHTEPSRVGHRPGHRGLRGRLGGLGRALRTHQPEGDGDGVVLALDPRAGGLRRHVASEPAPVVLPDTAWVNLESLDDDPELGELAGRYIPGENLLVINAKGATYTKLLASYVRDHKLVPGSKDRVETQVRSYFELLLQDAIVGLKRDFPTSWQDMATPAALTVRAAGVYHVDTRLRQVFNRLFKGGPVCDDVLVDAA